MFGAVCCARSNPNTNNAHTKPHTNAPRARTNKTNPPPNNKVFGIVAVQLAITLGFSLLCMYYAPIRAYVTANAWPMYTSWGVAIFLMLLLACGPQKLRRSYPTNVLLLGAFTVAEAFFVGMITCVDAAAALSCFFLWGVGGYVRFFYIFIFTCFGF